MANAAAWQTLAVSHEAAFSASSANAATTALDFQGIGGSSSAAAITALNTALELLAGWVQEKPPIAASAVAAYETAVSTMIPAAVSLANRAEQAADVAINPAVFGALTPAIVALDTEYFGEHWPHNASVGVAYGAALAALAAALAVPPPLAPAGPPAGPATAAAALAQTAGQAAAGEAMKASGQMALMTGDVAAAPAEAVGQLGEVTSTLTRSVQSSTAGAGQPLFGMFQTRSRESQESVGLPPADSWTTDPAGLGVTDAAIATPIAGGAGVSGTASGAPGSGLPAGLGGSRAAMGAFPGSGLTSYTRPATSFASEGAGRPSGLKSGVLSTAEQPGLTTPGAGVTTPPVSPARTGMLKSPKAGGAGEPAMAARAVLADQRQPLPRSS